MLIIIFHVLEPIRLKRCRCWPKPHTCFVNSNEVWTCQPGTHIDEQTVCCKVKETNQEQERCASERRKKTYFRVKALPDIPQVLKHKLRWLRNKRLGRFVTYVCIFYIFIYINISDNSDMFPS